MVPLSLLRGGGGGLVGAEFARTPASSMSECDCVHQSPWPWTIPPSETDKNTCLAIAEAVTSQFCKTWWCSQ